MCQIRTRDKRLPPPPSIQLPRFIHTPFINTEPFINTDVELMLLTQSVNVSQFSVYGLPLICSGISCTGM